MRSLRRFLLRTLFLSAAVLPGGFLLAESKHATKEEAQALATKAADFLQKEGPDKAVAAFNEGGGWREGDLYVFVIDKTGTLRANGAWPEVIGTKADLVAPVTKGMLAIDKSGWIAA
jgi:cytochrome c